jgi:hypothetical protein
LGQAQALLKKNKQIPIEISQVSHLLLNGKTPSTTIGALILMETWGYAPSEYQVVFENLDPIGKNVIDIPPIDAKVLEMARKDIYKQVALDLAILWESYNSFHHSLISRKVKEKCRERNFKMIELQRKTIEVEESAQQRISELPLLRKAHEAEALVLVHQTNDTRQKYAAGISQILQKSAAFLAATKKNESTLVNIRSAAELSKQRREFDFIAREHGNNIKTFLGQLSKEYDFAKGILIKSKEPGHHAAAWCIINENHLIGSEPIASELDRWRDKFDEQVEASFKETKTALTTLGFEYEYHIEDMEFAEKSANYCTRLRVALKAENARCKMWLYGIRKSIGSLQRSIDYCKSQSEFDSLFLQTKNMRKEILLVSHHFDCFPTGINLASFNFESPKNTWNDWFDEYILSYIRIIAKRPVLRPVTDDKNDIKPAEETEQGNKPAVKIKNAREQIKKEFQASKPNSVNAAPIPTPATINIPSSSEISPSIVPVKKDPYIFKHLIENMISDTNAKIFRIADIYFEKHAPRGIRRKLLLPYPRNAYMSLISEDYKIFIKNCAETASVHKNGNHYLYCRFD